MSKSTRSIQFKNRYPERFFSVGIAEADAVGISAGLATWGDPVLFTAYSVFATEKPFEQIRNMLCYPNLNVKIVATHGGINTGGMASPIRPLRISLLCALCPTCMYW